MKTPSDRFHELMRGIGPEQLAQIEREMDQLGDSPGHAALREDPDPFGQEWGWLGGTTASKAVSPTPRVAPAPARASRRGRFLWATGIAASLAAVAFGTWAAMPGRPALREQHMAAWVAHRLVSGDGGLTLSAAAEDGDADRSPITTGGDRPLDAKPPAQPNIYAPIRIQEQLVIPAVEAPGVKASRRPVSMVTEKVRPGSLFYLEFSSAGAAGEGTAVAVRVSPGPAKLLAQETSFGPSEGTSYIGPLKMGDGEGEYLVVIADRRGGPLLDTVSATLARGHLASDDVEGWRSRLAAALAKAGNEWYGVQRVYVRPDVVEAKPRPNDR